MPFTDVRAVLSVSNIENCISFYRDIIDFEIHTYSQADKWVLLTKDGLFIMLQEVKDHKPSGKISLCLFVDDLWGFIKKLKEKIPDLEDPQTSFAFQYGITLADPDGNAISFAQTQQ